MGVAAMGEALVSGATPARWLVLEPGVAALLFLQPQW